MSQDAGKPNLTQNAGILFGGSALSQLIAFLSVPILTRLFSPSDFGLLSLFVSVSAVISSIAGLRYELSINLPKFHRKSEVLTYLGLTLVTITSLVTALVFYVFRTEISSLLGSPDLESYILFIPVAVWSIGCFSVLNFRSLRHREYFIVSTSNVFRSSASALCQFLLGYFKFGALGLIAGYLAGNLVALVSIFSRTRKLTIPCNHVTRGLLTNAATEYNDFPKFAVWSTLANSLSLNAINLAISSFYSIATLGLYALVTRVLTAPISLLSQSVGHVFYQHASERKSAGLPVLPFLRTTAMKLTLLSLIPFSILYVYSEEIFGFAFGEDWKPAGSIAKILIPAYAIRSIVSPLSMVNTLHLENSIGLLANLILLAISVGSVTVGYFIGLEFKDVIMILSASLCVFYLCYFLLIYKRTQLNDLRRQKSH